jgi:hypothetical protein
MSAYLQEFMKSGRTILEDTKTPKPVQKKKDKAVVPSEAECSDPHKLLIRKTIQEKPKKADLIEEFGKFIKQAEASS